MKKLMLFFGLLLVGSSVSAQAYTTATGIRLGNEIGFTVQQRLLRKVTVEGILQASLARREVVVTGLLQRHVSLITRHFNVYGGGGVHKGWIDDPEGLIDDPLGVTLVGGAELTIGRFNIAYDFQPVINIQGGTETFRASNALSLRYVLIKSDPFKNKKKKKRKRKRRKRKKNKKPFKLF